MSEKSAYSVGTDGSHEQSEDGFAEFGDMVDAATFEQVCDLSKGLALFVRGHIKADSEQCFRFSKWTMTKKSANSVKA